MINIKLRDSGFNSETKKYVVRLIWINSPRMFHINVSIMNITMTLHYVLHCTLQKIHSVM